MTHRAIVIDKNPDYTATLMTLEDDALPEGDVAVDVLASTLNYKDALAITNRSPVVRAFPLTPGIDLVGKVTTSHSNRFKAGDLVLLNGFGVGELYSGGLSEKAVLKSEWLIPLPTKFSAIDAMTIGTAGYTAMLSIIALEQHGIKPESGKILVTGATGGVGSFAVYLLAKLGYHVIAVTGKESAHEYLYALGAKEMIARSKLSEPGKPLQKMRWMGAIDTVGSHTLVNVLAGTEYGGCVTACGLAQGYDLPGTVMPFILRNVTLRGIDSVMRPLPDRIEAWDHLAALIQPGALEHIRTLISLDDVIDAAHELIDGKITGRLVVDLSR
ncbi:oxidoreductase [Wohlfahrtiimonas chitiniclastica]|uniref:acrylyl-CoA reductase (NADPH) n=1 Tax=Wohlfahrtiimonas chitiniclastica TaxID=400946 RepID=UPI001BCB3A3D|nr:MDR family oxidoreductase [Wohlfahrtiimonas chitiniclastica]MBS7826065.1 oxidoreductase [Wohlfahrtiimonas chitiniclastica]